MATPLWHTMSHREKLKQEVQWNSLPANQTSPDSYPTEKSSKVYKYKGYF